MVVDLPAPFGPTNPVTWPGATVKVIPSRARVGPNRLRSPVTSMVASMPGRLGKRGPRSSRGGAVLARRCPGDAARPRPPREGRRDACRGDAARWPAATMAAWTRWRGTGGPAGAGARRLGAARRGRAGAGSRQVDAARRLAAAGRDAGVSRAVRAAAVRVLPAGHRAARAPAGRGRGGGGGHRGERAVARSLFQHVHRGRRGRAADRRVPAGAPGSGARRALAAARLRWPGRSGSLVPCGAGRVRPAASGAPTVLLAVAGAGGRRRGRDRAAGARSEAASTAPPGRSSRARWLSTRPAASGPASPASCTTSSRTTSR